jgi:allantoinase
MLDLAIVNGTVFLPTGLAGVDIGVADGKIVTLAQRGTLGEASRTIDAGGKLVLPGTIDSHFHCRAPSYPEREDFASGTRAAAAGGVTSVLEMPISVPPTTDGASLAERRSHAIRDAYVDVGFYSSPASLNPATIQSSVDEGAIAFKAFMQEVPVGREDEFTGICIYRNGDVLRAIQLVGETGLPAVFHAEDYDTLTLIENQLKEAGRTDVAAHWEWRPDYVEAISVGTLILMAEATGAHVHLPHISAGLSVDLIRNAKDRGVPVTAETCPQYLVFDHDTLRKHFGFAKCNPPFKTQDDIAALWEGLNDGTIDTIATDHSPFTEAEKAAGEANIWNAPPGFPGVEILTQFAVGAGLDGRLPLERAIEMITTNPADIFNLSPRKGRLLPGADADITIYDPETRVTVDTSTWETRSRAAARVWNGLEVTGKVVSTVLRGTVIFDGGKVIGEQGYGEILRPARIDEDSVDAAPVGIAQAQPVGED